MNDQPGPLPANALPAPAAPHGYTMDLPHPPPAPRASEKMSSRQILPPPKSGRSLEALKDEIQHDFRGDEGEEWRLERALAGH